MHKFLGAIEAGGTKFVCAIGTEDGKILQRIRIKTRTQAETMPEIIGFFVSICTNILLAPLVVDLLAPSNQMLILKHMDISRIRQNCDGVTIILLKT